MHVRSVSTLSFCNVLTVISIIVKSSAEAVAQSVEPGAEDSNCNAAGSSTVRKLLTINYNF